MKKEAINTDFIYLVINLCIFIIFLLILLLFFVIGVYTDLPDYYGRLVPGNEYRVQKDYDFKRVIYN